MSQGGDEASNDVERACGWSGLTAWVAACPGVVVVVVIVMVIVIVIMIVIVMAI